jgi:hypothetical protein
MPRKRKVESISPNEVKNETEIEVKNEVKNEASSSSTALISMPFMTDKVVEEEACPCYCVELSKAARAICKKCDDKIGGKVRVRD